MRVPKHLIGTLGLSSAGLTRCVLSMSSEEKYRVLSCTSRRSCSSLHEFGPKLGVRLSSRFPYDYDGAVGCGKCNCSTLSPRALTVGAHASARDDVAADSDRYVATAAGDSIENVCAGFLFSQEGIWSASDTGCSGYGDVAVIGQVKRGCCKGSHHDCVT